MSTPIDRSFESAHSPEDIWRALNTPLTNYPRVAEYVHPWLLVDYDDLGGEGQIQTGTGIVFAPNEDLVAKVPEALRSKIPKDINLRVGDHDGSTRTRTDGVVSSQAEGSVTYRVEEAKNGSGLVVVEGELSISGMLSMAEGMAIEHGVYQPTGRLLEQVPGII